MAVESGQTHKTQISGKTVFAAVVLLFVLCFMLYFGLFRKPYQQIEESLDIPIRTPAPSPLPTPEATPGLVWPDVDITSWELAIANDAHRLSGDFVPSSLTEIEMGQSVDSRIAEPLSRLLDDARAAGYSDLYFCSGYRSYQTQYQIYWNHIWEKMREGYDQDAAMAMTKKAVNAPGSSEHQLGLSADILENYDQDMEPYIAGSGLMLWLEEHCAEYGFIIRYPDGKTGITGVEYEPWHLRYVGETAAEFITENGLCLEEFLTHYGAYDK